MAANPGVTYNIRFYEHTIDTYITANPTSANEWMYNLVSSYAFYPYHLVGVDIKHRQTSSSSSITPLHFHPFATLQICIQYRCLILQLCYLPYLPPEIVAFLTNINTTFFGVGIRADLERLLAAYGIGFGRTTTVDLIERAAYVFGREDLRRTNLRGLAMALLGKEIEKPLFVERSAWDRYRLSASQIRYAAIDAFACYIIGRFMHR